MAKISSRLEMVPASPIRKLVPLAQAAKALGKTVYHLNIGDPDIPTPQVMMAAVNNFGINPVRYGHSQGEAELLTALKSYYQTLGYGFLETKNIQVTEGGSEALAMAMLAVCEVGDEILVPEPFFTGYASLAPIYGVTLKPIPLSIENGFHLPERSVIEALISPKTKAILYCSPNNPTGTVFSREEIERLVAIAKDRGIFLVADEVYREFVFDGREQLSLLTYMQSDPEHLIVLDSLSKRYSVPGFRIGCLVSLNQDLMAGVLRMAMGRLSASLIDQVAAAELTKVSREEILAVRDEYQRRRDVVYRALSEVPGVTIQRPEGAFYAVVKLPVQAEAFCSWLLTDYVDPSASSGQAETVMLAPMPGFYATPGLGEDEVRIAYVIAIDKLTRAVELIKVALQKYGNT